jgi:hypothetical protein
MLVKANDVDDWTLIKRTAREFINEDNDSFEAAVVMIAAIFKGPSEEEITRVTGYREQFVSQIGTRLRESGLWTNDGTDYQEWDHATKMGFIRFAMDLEVAEGILFRTEKKVNGSYVYRSLIYGRDPVN